MGMVRARFLAWGIGILLGLSGSGAELFRVGTYNLENYIGPATASRPVKTAEGKAKVCESILAMKADVVALQEMGTTNELLELRASLRKGGIDYPHWEWVSGFDTNIHLAVLSRFPLTARRPHTNDSFLLGGRRFQVSRGFLEVEIQAGPAYKFTLLNVHLKSRRPIAQADETELREQEARVLREKIDACFRNNPQVNLVVTGDFNDVKDSRAVRSILGRGKNKLIDLRPAEGEKADSAGSPARELNRQITWTHFYEKEDVYSRIDYILLSPGMAKEWLPAETSIVTVPNWGAGSDHRPLVAGFVIGDQ